MARIHLTLGRMGQMIRVVAPMTRKPVCVIGTPQQRMKHRNQWGRKN